MLIEMLIEPYLRFCNRVFESVSKPTPDVTEGFTSIRGLGRFFTSVLRGSRRRDIFQVDCLRQTPVYEAYVLVWIVRESEDDMR